MTPLPGSADACPDENRIRAYLDGALTSQDGEALSDHLDRCDECREVVAGLVRAEVPAEADPALGEHLPPQTRLGRYLIREVIGRGAMGTVYAAFDPELDREVALKVLTPGASGDPNAVRERLLAEAQTFARLSHPNVVAIHDVGTAAGEVFFAMERVRGTTLREAVARAGSFRQVLRLFFAAGEGLAAAHEAGIVHRDFKPENVLVSEDGRVVRVTDFGLAASRAEAEREHRLVGTPAYMAPEQARGSAADPRSDQFAFCVALHEALFGWRPQQPPLRARRHWAPREVQRVLRRGFSSQPDARWPSMRALLEALARAARPFPAGRTAAGAALILLAGALAARHQLAERAVRRELTQAAQRLGHALEAERALLETRLQTGLEAPALLEALQRASDLDVSLGLAPPEESVRAMAEGHALLRSADLPELKSSELLYILDSAGKVVFENGRPEAFGPPAPAEVLALASRAGGGQALWPARERDAGLLWVRARPVVRPGQVLGAVIAGWRMNDAVFGRLRRTVGAEVALRAPGGDWGGATLGEASSPDGTPVRLFDGTQPVRAVGVALETLGPELPAGHAYVYRLEPEAAWSALARTSSLIAALGALLWLSLRAWRFRRGRPR